MKFSQLWRISAKLYREVSFQSIFSLRAGAGLPQNESGIKRLVRNAEINTLVSKLLTSVFIAIFCLTVFLPSNYSMSTQTIPKDLAVVGGVSAFLVVVLFLIIVMGLQVSTAFVSSRIVEMISSLPISRREASNIIFLCFIRVFDIPLVAATVVFMVAYALIGGSLIGGVISFAAILVTEIFAVAITIGLSRFFYARIAGGGGRSKWRALLRFVFTIVWILPSFGTYIVVNFGINIVQSFASFADILSSNLQFLVAVYPFTYGFLTAYSMFSLAASQSALALMIASSVGYLALGVLSFRWVIRTIREIGAGGIITSVREKVKDTIIRPQIAWLGIIRKDLRVASRSPSFASLFFLPAIQTAILAMSLTSFGVGVESALGILTGTSTLTLLLPPTLFSIEGLASSYTRSLPLTKKTLIRSKAFLTTITYLISLGVLLGVTLYLRNNVVYIGIFGCAQAFAIAAASMLELTILTDKFWKKGEALGNLYARLSTYVLVIAPGLVTVALPIILGFAFYFLGSNWTVPAFVSVALAEFAVMWFIVSREN